MRKQIRWRSIAQVEATVRRGLAGGYCKPVTAREPYAFTNAEVNGAIVPMPIGYVETTRFRRKFRMALAMDCEEPFTYELHARYDGRGRQAKPIWVEVETRCRKCERCRKRKSMYWAGRAITEFQRNPSTYMVTLTFAPEVHYFYDAVMHERFPHLNEELKARQGLASATLFAYRARVLGHEVTKYLWRLRKRARFRTMIVAEAHAESGSAVAGRPHFHILLHEVEDGTLILDTEWRPEAGFCTRCNRVHDKPGEVCDHAFVRYQWAHGFTKVVRCVDAKSVYYLCKYVSKALASRVRASKGYGVEDAHEHGPGGDRISHPERMREEAGPPSGLSEDGHA